MNRALRFVFPVAGLFALVFSSASARAWENDGHQMINHLAAANLPDDLPAFLRVPPAVEEIEYLGPEPDRWRSPSEPELVAAQAPEHFIDLEPADALGQLPHKRFDFEALVFASGQRPDKVGLLPWQTEEVWQRLKQAMRQYRVLSAAKQDTKPVQAAILFYAGWLGHYVGDGSQPLHVTVNYNGWTGPNPNGYSAAHQIHHVFEGTFVSANIRMGDVQAKMTTAKAIHGDIFDAFMAYLHHSATYVEKVYQLDKAKGFSGAGTAESRDFTAARLADGASMLRDMIYTAWVESAHPVPDPFAGK